jgi:RND family efflux transporter MFP subunit
MRQRALSWLNARARVDICVWLVSLILGSSTGCRDSPKAAAHTAASPSESALGRVTLTAEAEQRLGIPAGLLPVAQRTLTARRLLGGEILAVPGRAAWVMAAHAGVVQSPAGALFPVPGSRVRAGQVLALLAPLLAPTERLQISSARVDADAQVARAQVQQEAAELAFRRAERLLAAQVAGTKLLDEAKAQLDTAQAALRSSLAQRDAVLGSPGRAGAMAMVAVEAPIDGVLREVRVTRHQQVSAGAPLFEVVADKPLWVRVQVPSTELAQLVAAAPAQVAALAAAPSSPPILVLPVQPSPLTTQPQQGLVDRYFVLPESAGLQLGQRVSVWLALSGAEVSPVVPAASILYDPSGGAWLYERTAAQVFTRRHVEVVRMEEGLAVLSPRSLATAGLHLGSIIVTAGAMELYGAEFGTGK